MPPRQNLNGTKKDSTHSMGEPNFCFRDTKKNTTKLLRHPILEPLPTTL